MKLKLKNDNNKVLYSLSLLLFVCLFILCCCTVQIDRRRMGVHMMSYIISSHRKRFKGERLGSLASKR